MAYASWVSPNKVSGNGDDTVSWSASEHTGRNSRTTTATFAASGVTPSPTLTIIQSGKTEFVEMDDTGTVAKAGGTVAGKLAGLAEGPAAKRTDIQFLGTLPHLDAEGRVKEI